MEEELDKNLSKRIPLVNNNLDLVKEKKIFNQEDLTYLMHKLKNHYNFLQKTRIDNKAIIDMNRFQERKYENLIKEGLSNVKECNINEDITLFTDSSTENLQLRVENLQSARRDISMKLEDEMDYSLTLRNKLKIERENILYYNDVEIEVRDKLKSISKSFSSLNINQNQHNKRTRNLSKITDMISDKIRTMNTLIYDQTSKSSDISNNLNLQRTGLIHEKEILTKNSQKMEKVTIGKKNKYIELMRSIDLIKNNKVEKENTVIKTILGLDLLKTYLQR